MAAPANTVAFIGLGVMGYPMAVNWRKKISRETTFLIADVNKDVLDRFSSTMGEYGPVKVVSDGREAVEQADTVLTMLPSAGAVKSVYLHPYTGILRAAEASGRPKLLVECGTIGQETILEVATAAKKIPGITFVDAPVSGGPMGSEAGTLSFMVGSTKDEFARVKEILLHMGNKEGIWHCGEVGAGTAFKIINNYISLVSVLSVSESLNIGAQLGLDLKLLTDVINTSGGQCWVTSKNNPVPGIHANAPASHGYKGGFRLELAEKVMQMGEELARSVKARTFLAAPTKAAFIEANNDPRYHGLDARVLYKWLNENLEQ